MSEEVKRIGRDLAYEGTVIKVYKDHMKFAMVTRQNGILSIMTGQPQLFRSWTTEKYLWSHSTVMRWSEIRLKSRQENWMRRESLELNALPENWRRRRDNRSENLEWLITLRTTVAFCDEKIDIYVAKNLIPSHQHLDEDEFINVGAYTIDELRKKIYSGEIEDSKTVAALLAYADKYGK